MNKSATNFKTVIANDWNELIQSLSTNPKCIVFHIDIIHKKEANISDFIHMLETFIRFNDRDKKPDIAVVISPETTTLTIKELQKNKILGIIPDSNNWPSQELTDAMSVILSGKSYWPEHIINKLPGNVDKDKNKDIQLTARQKEVYELISDRGLSNKQIAKVLRISESTVKIHVSAILKTLCVRNRTQLALTKI
jgi:DNA-binding NarL/FixJ family response regulator